MKTVYCALCGADDPETVDHHPEHTINLGASQFVRDITNVICRRCGLVYNNPCMETGELASLYQAMSRAFERPDEITETDAPEPTGEQIEQFEFVRSELGDKALDGLRAMEIGCSLGHFLRLFRDAGACVYGVEPSRADADFARRVNGIEVRNEFFEPDWFPPESLDLIAMFYVFEHIEDPRAMLLDIARQLRRGGRLLLEVPDTTEPFVGLDSYFSLGHLFSYSPGTLTAFLSEAGLVVSHIEQLEGLPDTGKDFGRLRVMAQKHDRAPPRSVEGEEYERMRDRIARWRADRDALIERTNRALKPWIRRWNDQNTGVVVYGAGTHSSELLSHTEIRAAPLRGFADRNPVLAGHSYLGLPVVLPDEIPSLDAQAIVISARAWERAIWEDLAEPRRNGFEVVPLYHSDLVATSGDGSIDLRDVPMARATPSR